MWNTNVQCFYVTLQQACRGLKQSLWQLRKVQFRNVRYLLICKFLRASLKESVLVVRLCSLSFIKVILTFNILQVCVFQILVMVIRMRMCRYTTLVILVLTFEYVRTYLFIKIAYEVEHPKLERYKKYFWQIQVLNLYCKIH